MNAIILDDEIKAVETLSLMLEKYCSEVNVVAKASSIQELLNLQISESVDIVFLDINFGEYTGFDILKMIDRKNAEVIFVTAFDNYGIEAVKNSAFDYILKPVDPEELIESIRKLSKLKKSLSKKPSTLNKQSLLIPEKNAYVRVDLSEVLYLEANGAYTQINTLKKVLTSSKNLKYFESQIQSDRFFRVHTSFIINLDMVDKVRMGRDQPLFMNNGVEIPISRNKRKELLDLL